MAVTTMQGIATNSARYRILSTKKITFQRWPRMTTVINLIAVFALVLGLLSFAAQSQAFELPTVELKPGENAPHLAPYIRYAKEFDGEISHQSLVRNHAEFDGIEGGSIQFGSASSNIVILTKVKNVGNTDGHWVFSTDRGSATTLQIYHVSPKHLTLRFDSDDYSAARETLLTYQHYADPLSLAPQQELIIVVRSSVEDSAYFPLVLQDRDHFIQSSNLTMMLAAGCTAAILALLLLNFFFYLSTGRSEFVWLVAAEFFLATVVMYLVGFLSTYVFFDKPMWGLIFGDVTKYGYVACMSQFARVFVNTAKNLPKTDIFLKGLIFFSLLMVVVQLFSNFIPVQIRISLHGVNYLIVAASSLYFTYIGIYATRKVGWENWPLIVAWGSLAAFAIYAACAFSGVIPNMPMSFYAIAPVAVIEAAFATLALGLNMRKAEIEHNATKQKYLEGLQEKLASSEASQRLAEEKSAALATVVDQSALLHASGHDSQQVLLALNSVLDVVQSTDDSLTNDDIATVLQSSASYLDKIVASTLSGARMGNVNIQLLGLSVVSASDILQPLEMMYRQLFVRKGLQFSVELPSDIKLITDRALLTRALSNFLSNSHKFTERGGVTVSVTSDQQYAYFNVDDTGCGLPELMVEQLNNQSDGRVRKSLQADGTGSGFRYAQKVISNMNGSVQIEQASGRTRVIAKLPLTQVLTPCSLSELQAISPTAQLLDWDCMQEPKETNQKTDDQSEHEANMRVVTTYDESTSTRQALGTKCALILYKPLYLEYANYIVEPNPV
jgi:signal transduction histidine kinase